MCISKIAKATVSFIISVSRSFHLSVRMEHLVFHWMGFREIWCWWICVKYVDIIQVWYKYDKNIAYFTWRPVCRYKDDPIILPRIRKWFHIVEKIKIVRFALRLLDFTGNPPRLCVNVENYFAARLGKIDNSCNVGWESYVLLDG